MDVHSEPHLARDKAQNKRGLRLQRMERIFAVAILLALLSAVAVAGTLHRQDGASIVDSGSTNTQGFKVDVWSTGRAHISVANSSRWGRIESELSGKLFADLKAARNANAQGQSCMKSASFGSRRIASWHGWSSPDLQCPLDGPAAALKADVDALVTQLNLSQPPGRIIRLPRNEPRSVPQATPTPPQ